MCIMKLNNRLEQLSISGNRIGTKGAEEIAEALKVNEGLGLTDVLDSVRQ